MNMPAPVQLIAETIRVRGLVQGVGFRPTVWKLAHELDLTGEVLNDGDGVLIQAQGELASVNQFIENLHIHCPPLARIDSIERQVAESDFSQLGFNISTSHASAAHTGIVPDAATCPDCLADINDPTNRRFGYAFTNCTHCGPRLSIVNKIPYDRANTSMAKFELCEDCLREYENPADRRFHAQPNACPTCGPKLWLEDASSAESVQCDDVISSCASLIQQGHILAIKGIGGFHLACDASNEEAVQLLRTRKHRYQKPLAMMAKDVQQIKNYCNVSANEAAALQSAAAPIVVLKQSPSSPSPAHSVAPGQNNLGFMLPYSPLHHLLMAQLDGPIVLTSGNRSEEPQCISNEDAHTRLRNIADYLLMHDRDIVNRIDDSVVRNLGERNAILRRARGIAPAPLPLPDGFENAPELLAFGGELKNTFCLLKDGQAVLSQHTGDLEDARTWQDCLDNLQLYSNLYQHQPDVIAVDLHPEYLSSKEGRERAVLDNCPLYEIQHHHSHIASCLGDNNYPLTGEPVLGIAMDGLGYGEDGNFWGGEFLLADYLQSERLGHLKSFPMLGGAQAMREPWRNTYAHISKSLQWSDVTSNFGQLSLIEFLLQKPLTTFDAMMDRGTNAPLASSCGRLFDAVSAAAGVCAEQAQYEGQAAIELEAAIESLDTETPYPFLVGNNTLDPAPMWQALLDDLRNGASSGTISARFHQGLALAISELAVILCTRHSMNTIALSGGVFQNKTLLELCQQALKKSGLTVLSHQRIPANDGGLAFGQALIAAAKYLRRT